MRPGSAAADGILRGGFARSRETIDESRMTLVQRAGADRTSGIIR